MYTKYKIKLGTLSPKIVLTDHPPFNKHCRAQISLDDLFWAECR